MLRKTSDRMKKGFAAALMAAALAAAVGITGALASESDRMPALEDGEKGSLTVNMTYTDPNLETDNVKAMPGVEVKLAQVADLTVNGGSADYALLAAYQSSGVTLAGMTADASNKAAAALRELVPASDVKTGTTGSDGKVTFADLDPGMYLVFQDTGANTSYRVDAVATFLVAVPQAVQAAAGNSWEYAVSVYPKTQLDGPANNGSITVTKELYNTLTSLTYSPPENTTILFYVGLFTDEACTVRAAGTADMPLSFTNSSSAQAVFENLTTDTTYYIAETDGAGNVVPSVYLNDVLFEALYPNGQSVSITRNDPAGAISFQNGTNGLPSGYYYGGELTVTKVTKKDGEAYGTDNTYYAGIFTDAAFTTRYGDLIELKMDGNYSYSVTLDVNIGTSENDSATYYIAETDSSGRVLDASAQAFTISVSKEGGKVTLTPSSSSDEVTITNSYTSGSVLSTETVSETTQSSAEEGKEEPRTGDETPVMQYIIIMAAALVVILAGVMVKRKRR